jgi:hypothetical protein
MNDFWAGALVGAALGIPVGLFVNELTEYLTRFRSHAAAKRLEGRWTAHNFLDGRNVDRQTQMSGAGLTVISAKPWWKACSADSHVLDVNAEDISDGRHHSGRLVIDNVCPRLATRIVLYSAPSDEVSEQRIVVSHDFNTLYVFPVDTVATLGAVYGRHALCRL